MKNVYIVLTNTGTVLSKIVRSYTKDEFAHSSISLDSELKQMYSFGRKNPYNPFWGGFMHEGLDIGTFKRFKKTKSQVYELKVTDEQYDSIENTINEFMQRKDELHFNTMGLFMVSINRRRVKKDYYYCAEFVKTALERANINLDLPEIIRPECFKVIGEEHLVYKGLFRNYKYNENNV